MMLCRYTTDLKTDFFVFKKMEMLHSKCTCTFQKDLDFNK